MDVPGAWSFRSMAVIGRFSQDREAGIAGTVGVFPMVVPLRVAVTNKTLKRERAVDRKSVV